MEKTMTKTIFTLLFMAASAFGQDRQVFKEFFDNAFASSQREAAELEQLIPVRDKAFTDLSVALGQPVPLKVREAFDAAWTAGMKADALMNINRRGAEYLRGTAKTALEYKEITAEQSKEALALAARQESLAKLGEQKPEYVALHKKVFEYTYKESGRISANLKKAIDARKKAAEELAKKIEGDPVKKDVYAKNMFDAHVTVFAIAKQLGELNRILWHSEYEYKEGRMKEKEYDRAQELKKKLDELDKGKWAPKDQLEIYKRVAGVDGLVSFVMQ
jgi:hypothetical protein